MKRRLALWQKVAPAFFYPAVHPRAGLLPGISFLFILFFVVRRFGCGSPGCRRGPDGRLPGLRPAPVEAGLRVYGLIQGLPVQGLPAGDLLDLLTAGPLVNRPLNGGLLIRLYLAGRLLNRLLNRLLLLIGHRPVRLLLIARVLGWLPEGSAWPAGGLVGGLDCPLASGLRAGLCGRSGEWLIAGLVSTLIGRLSCLGR